MNLKYSNLGKRQQSSGIARLMTLALESPDVLSLAAGFTDNSTLPMVEVQRVVADFDAGDVEVKKVLQYGSNRGRPELRKLLAARAEAYDGKAEGSYDPHNVFVTNGSQQGLYLAILTLCDPGDIVLVEQPTYFVFLEILKGLGVEAVPMPMLDSGEVDTAMLAELVDSFRQDGRIERLKAVYLVSYYANPTGHSISAKTKGNIGRLLLDKAGDVALIEDAAYRDLFFEAPFSGSSMLALPGCDGLSVFYSSTLTKPFATGLKIGYGYCTDSDWLERMLIVKGQQDFGTSNFGQAVLEDVLSDGAFDTHLVGLRRSYATKMEMLNRVLKGGLDGLDWKWTVPSGGLYLWLKSPSGLRTDFESPFHSACIEEGVMYVPGDLCHGTGMPQDQIRLSYGVLDLEELKEAGRRFCRAAQKIG